MNKSEFITRYNKFISEHKLNPTDVHCSHGGTMLMLGLREETQDMDLTVSRNVWDYFLNKGYAPVIIGDNFYLISVNEYIDIHLTDVPVTDKEISVESGVRFRNAERTLKDKMTLNRPKDKKDIEKLISYLSGHFTI